MTAILAIAVLSLLASFTCSLFEAALYAITPPEVEVLRGKKLFGAERIARLRAHIDEPIAAILTINTVAHTLGATICGALVAEYYGDYYAGIHGEEAKDLYVEWALGVFSAVFTIAVLVVSEIIPKSLGVRFAVPLAPKIAWPLQVMIWVSWPIARSARGLMKLLSSGEVSGPTEEEVRMLSRLAHKGGQLLPQELRWVENALQLDTVTAKDLMTPRTVVDSLPADLLVSQVGESERQWVHTRMPLIEDGNPDSIVGLLHGRDLFLAVLKGNDSARLRDLAQPLDFVPEGMKGHQLLDKFIVEKKHLVAVVDEYGGFEGIVTLEDVLECLLGSEIVDEHDRHADLRQVARRMAEERAQQVEGEDEPAAGS